MYFLLKEKTIFYNWKGTVSNEKCYNFQTKGHFFQKEKAFFLKEKAFFLKKRTIISKEKHNVPLHIMVITVQFMVSCMF